MKATITAGVKCPTCGRIMWDGNDHVRCMHLKCPAHGKKFRRPQVDIQPVEEDNEQPSN